MINPFNVSHSKVVNLRGTHHAATVFCHHVVKHEGDVHYAWLHCDELIELGDDFVVEPDTCNHDDRVYFGELHIRGIYGIDAQSPTEIEPTPDIYPRFE